MSVPHLPPRTRGRRGLARLLAPLALLLPLAACAREAPRSGLLITLDTTNARALGCYGRDLGHTPHLDRLAAEGLVFDRARAVAPLTLPSHSSMLTGLYPLRHGVRDNGFVPLPASAETLAERAREAGFATAAFIAAAVLDAPYGLAQGFEVYDVPPANRHERPAQQIADAAVSWLEQRDGEQPFFAWIHFFDPHAPYAPPREHLERLGGRPYFGEIANVDDAVGRILEVLRAKDLLDDTVVVVAGDHGEAFGRHGEPTHSVLCYDATLHVPLYVRLPDERRAGERSDATVSIVDVYPTFLEALDLGTPGDVDGRSLLGPLAPDRGVYFESYCGYLNYGWSPLAGWVDHQGKYLHSSRPELYAPHVDQQEQRNLVHEREDLVRAHRERIARLADLPRLDPAAGETLDAEYRQRVQALGYAGTSDPSAEIPHPLAESDRPAPQERTEDLNAFYEAAVLLEQGQLAQAVARMRTLAEAHPDNAYARAFLGKHLSRQGEHRQALVPLQELVDLGWERADTLEMLGTCYEVTGEPERALEMLRKAHELTPHDTRLRDRVVRLLRKLGREDEAAEVERLFPDSP